MALAMILLCTIKWEKGLELQSIRNDGLCPVSPICHSLLCHFTHPTTANWSLNNNKQQQQQSWEGWTKQGGQSNTPVGCSLNGQYTGFEHDKPYTHHLGGNMLSRGDPWSPHSHWTPPSAPGGQEFPTSSSSLSRYNEPATSSVTTTQQKMVKVGSCTTYEEFGHKLRAYAVIGGKQYKNMSSYHLINCYPHSHRLLVSSNSTPCQTMSGDVSNSLW